jgi:homocitrate synthase
MDDARIAVETGVDGVDIVIGTSSFLREHSHGKDMDYIHKAAIEVIEFVKSKNIEVRFSSEDSFRSDLVDLLSIYRTVDKIGVNRVGIADTVCSLSKFKVDRILGWMCQSKTSIRSCQNSSGCCILRY